MIQCEKPGYSTRGWCSLHHVRMLNDGKPGHVRKLLVQGSFEERFWNKVDKNGPIPEYRPDLGPCWMWLVRGEWAKTYGGLGGRSAYRITYEWFVGPIPDGFDVDHLCRNPPCVNPTHLEAVTHVKNIMRGYGKMANQSRQTHCKNGHRFVEGNLKPDPVLNRRICRLCLRQSARHDRFYKKIAKIQMAWLGYEPIEP